MSRLAVPAALKRRLHEEAGYRCAVPTCRGTSSLQMEHIDEWSEVKEHKFENMIVLCANCHGRVTSKEIHKDAVRNYKRNLAITNGRYSLFEMRLLEKYQSAKIVGGGVSLENGTIYVTESDLLHLAGLLYDDMITATPLPVAPLFPAQDGKVMTGAYKGLHAGTITDYILSLENKAKYIIFPTEKGIQFVKKYFEGKDIK